MKQDHLYKKPDPTPLIVCLIIAIAFAAWCCFMGYNIVRVWYYKGALGPAHEKYLIIPLHRKKKAQAGHARATSTGVDLHSKSASGSLHATAAANRKTVFPAIAEQSPENPFSDEHVIPDSKPYWATIPAINVEDVDERYIDGFKEYQDPELVRRYIAEERRISRLPAFEQDDCGDGTEFPSVPYANQVVETRTSRAAGADNRNILRDFRMSEESRNATWLTMHTAEAQMQLAREKLLEKEHAECVQVRPDGEAACEELLDTVTRQLCRGNVRFNEVVVNGRKHMRNQINSKDYSITRPFEYHPIEICARLAAQDFCVFMKDEFTQKWYLQASATLFPAGWHMRKHIGKPLSAIIDGPEEPFRLWSPLPDVLNAIHHSTTLHTRTSTFIQAPPTPAHPSLPQTLFIQRPQDLFSGSIFNLQPPNLYVRREFQTFRTLPVSGAVVMSTRTELTRLTDVVDLKGKRELLGEIEGWGESEGEFKGRDLVVLGVRAHFVGDGAFRDDRSVVGE